MAEPIAQNGTAGEASASHQVRNSRDRAHDPDDGINRTSNWWTAAAYNITAIVGLGVLGLPHAMVFLSWGGLVVMALPCFITYFTLKQLVELHEVDPGKRYMMYQSLANRAFGYPLGQRIVLPMQMVVEVSLDVLFTVAVGEAMIRILRNCDNHGDHQVPIYIWFVAFGAIQVSLSCVFINYSSIKWIAVVAAIMSTCYSTIAWITLVSAKVGVIAFAFAAHNVVLDIQNNLPSPSEKAMMKGVKFTYLVVSLCYFPMGIAVYSVYGRDVSSNALGFMMGKVPHGWVITTNVMLIVHLIGSYQIFAIPVFTLLEVVTNYPSYVVRTIYIVSTTLLAIMFPFFSPLLGFFGGFVIAPTTYILPCILWLRIDEISRRLAGRPRRWTKAHYINFVCIIFGTLIMIVAIVGGIATLIKQLRIYDFYDIFSNEEKIWKKSGKNLDFILVVQKKTLNDFFQLQGNGLVVTTFYT